MKEKTNIKREEQGLSPRLVGTADLAEIIGVTPRRVRQLVAEGVISKPDTKGRHDLAAAVQAVIAQARAGRETSELSASRKGLFDIKARKEALEVARLEGTLIELSEAEAMLSAATAACLAAFSRLPPLIAGRANVTERRRIEAIIDSTRNELANEFDRLANETEED